MTPKQKKAREINWLIYRLKGIGESLKTISNNSYCSRHITRDLSLASITIKSTIDQLKEEHGKKK